MAAKKLKKEQAPTRTPADKILLDFIKSQKIVLIVDDVNALNTDIEDALYSMTKKLRVRALYLDEINKTNTSSNGEVNKKVDIVT